MVKRSERTDGGWIRALAAIARRTAGRRGLGYFDALAAALIDDLGLDWVLVSETEPGREDVLRARLAERDAGIRSDVEIRAAGLPCGDVVRQGRPLLSADVASEYPDNEFLRRLGVAWYAGAPLFDAAGEVFGTLGVMHRGRRSEGERILEVLEILAARAAPEMQRVRAEARREALLEALPDLVVRIGRDGRYRDAHAGTAVLPALPAEAFLGRTVHDVLPPDVAADCMEAIAAALATGEPQVKECQLDLPEGRRDYEARLVACGPDEVIGFVRDVTDRRRLLDAQKQESLGALAGGIAHEFNNLLVAILGNAGLALRDATTGSSLWRCLTDIETAARRAAALARQMLACSGRGHFEMRSLDLAALLREMRHLLELTAPRPATLRCSAADDLPLVRADASQVRQALLALVTNAGEAEASAIEIDIRPVRDRSRFDALRGATPGKGLPFVCIEVRDDGEGMDPATRARVFDPFFSTRGTGRGLGLPAVLGIARGHGGAVELESEPGRGARVRLLFPAVAAAPPRSPEPSGRAGRAVLVVDDESTVRSVLEQMLASLDRRVLLARDGREALRLFRERSDEIDTVLLDLTMPHMGGGQVLRELRRLRPGVRIVVMSGYDERCASDLLARTRSRFLAKPFTLEELRSRLV